MKANRPAPGMPASLKADAGQQGLDDCDADDALGYRAYGRTRQLQKMFTLFGHDAREKTPARRNELRAVRKEEASQRHRQEKLERSHAGIAREAEHGASQRFQMGSHLAQGRSNVVGRLVPEFEKLRTDERPVFDAVRRRRNHQVASTQIGGEILHTFHGA